MPVRRAAHRAQLRRQRPPADALMRVLRAHGAGRWPPLLARQRRDGRAVHARRRLLAASQTTASWVSDLHADGALHWATGTAAPCTSLFKPFRVEQPAELGPLPDDRFDPRTLWWRHERLHRCALRDPATAHELFTAERDDVERRWLSEPPTGAAAVAEADQLLARWVERARAAVRRDVRPPWVRHYWRVRNRRAELPGVLRLPRCHPDFVAHCPGAVPRVRSLDPSQRRRSAPEAARQLRPPCVRQRPDGNGLRPCGARRLPGGGRAPAARARRSELVSRRPKRLWSPMPF